MYPLIYWSLYPCFFWPLAICSWFLSIDLVICFYFCFLNQESLYSLGRIWGSILSNSLLRYTDFWNTPSFWSFAPKHPISWDLGLIFLLLLNIYQRKQLEICTVFNNLWEGILGCKEEGNIFINHLSLFPTVNSNKWGRMKGKWKLIAISSFKTLLFIFYRCLYFTSVCVWVIYGHAWICIANTCF